MDSRESLAPSPSLQRHQSHHQQQQQLPPGMMMPPNSYTTHHYHHQHLPNNSKPTPATANNNNNMMSHDSMQQCFPFDASDQFGDGSSPSGGFRSGGFSIEPARKKRGRPRKYSSSSDGNIALALAPALVTTGFSAGAGGGGGHLESSNDGGSAGGGTPNTDSSAKKHRGRPPGSGRNSWML